MKKKRSGIQRECNFVGINWETEQLGNLNILLPSQHFKTNKKKKAEILSFIQRFPQVE